MPGRATRGDPRVAGGRGREGRCGPETSTEVSVEGVDKAGWADEDWLVCIVPAGSRVQGPSQFLGTCLGW